MHQILMVAYISKYHNGAFPHLLGLDSLLAIRVENTEDLLPIEVSELYIEALVDHVD